MIAFFDLLVASPRFGGDPLALDDFLFDRSIAHRNETDEEIRHSGHRWNAEEEKEIFVHSGRGWGFD